MKFLYALLFFIPLGSVGQTALFDQGYWYKIGVTEEGIYKIDKNFLGIPKEQFGFSNNVMGRLSAPSFEQAKFKVEGNTLQNIQLK